MLLVIDKIEKVKMMPEIRNNSYHQRINDLNLIISSAEKTARTTN